jgi:hypothetical protein
MISTWWKTPLTLRLDIPPGGIYPFPAGGVFHLVERSTDIQIRDSTKWNFSFAGTFAEIACQLFGSGTSGTGIFKNKFFEVLARIS